MTLHDVSSNASRSVASHVPGTLTDRTIKALKPRAKQYDVRDSQVRWLALRVNRNSKSWVFVGRINGGRATRTKLGEYPTMGLAQARVEALRWRSCVVEGKNPTKPKATVHRFDAVCEDYFRNMERRKLRQAWMVEREVKRLLLPLWGTRSIADITRADVTDMMQDIIDRGYNALAHRTFAYTSRVFSYAVERDLIAHSPCDRIRPARIIGPRPIRTHVLTDAEIKAIWHSQVPVWSAFARMLLLTGARRGEVAGMRWSEVSGDVWVVPPERYKTGAAHVVPIVSEVRRLLDSLPRWDSCDYVFSTNGSQCLTGFSNGKALMDRASGIRGWRWHDLRRSMRTHLSALPVSDLVRELVIGHARPGLHKVYDQHAYLDEKRLALTLWAERLLRVVR